VSIKHADPISRIIPNYCGMAERVRKRRQVVVLRAFFDESGLDPTRNKSLIMGGFLGSVEELERASTAWDECLHSAPSIEYFKYSECKSLDEQFLKFNRDTADAKELALAKIINNFKLLGFCATVSYTWFVHRDAKASKGMQGSRPYDWGFGAATSGVVQWVDAKFSGDDKVDFIFDDRPELESCIEVYNLARNNPLFGFMKRAGVCVPGEDKTTPALQMADLLAGECCSYVDTKVKSDSFLLIRDINKIVHVPCKPPRQMPNTLRLQAMLKAVQSEASDFLRRTKKQSPDRFASVDEVDNYLTDLAQNEADFQTEWQKHLVSLSTDGDFQDFLTKHLAMKKEDEFTNFDRTMRDLIKVSHDELKAAIDAEKVAKQKKKRRAKKPSASDHVDGEND